MPKINYLILALLIFFIPRFSFAECSFNTSNFIDELLVPKSILSLEVKVPKSSKFNRNFAKIVSAKSGNIPPNLRKKFTAYVTVKYKFGTCRYKAIVRQNGDWKDHIKFLNGQPLRSLNVNLIDGNIQNAVKFKLLIPETRNHFNEILGTIILHELGFTAPETFEVLVDINGVKSIMLFQENAEKEMLERNKRREGPIFEGDESLSWSSKGREYKYDEISLSRMVNKKWFSLSTSSETIALASYNKIQSAYLELTDRFSGRISKNDMIFPNNKRSTNFQDFAFLMFVMNGTHALIPHNRKYYYNSFLQSFEPIYYDGNLNLDQPMNTHTLKKIDQTLRYSFQRKYAFPHLERLQSEYFITKVSTQFLQKLANHTTATKNFVELSIKQIKINSDELQNKISQVDWKLIPPTPSKQLLENYNNKIKQHRLKQRHIKLEKRVENFYLGQADNQTPIKLTTQDLGRLISDNTFNGERAILLPQTLPLELGQPSVKKYYLNKEIGGILVSSRGIHFDANINDRIITIDQAGPLGWVLFRDADLTNWTINFNGKINEVFQNLNEQRFNSNGMTGCITFYNSKFKNTSISVADGQCEDSLNIVNSNGNISNIFVKNAFADAVDLDFSMLDIDKAFITNAGNDCLDVSGGTYTLAYGQFKNCFDKGISVGEISNLTVKEVFINQTNIAVSSKDFSKTTISKLTAKNVLVCIHAKHKKQEFGGAFVRVKEYFCDGALQKDNQSTIVGAL